MRLILLPLISIVDMTNDILIFGDNLGSIGLHYEENYTSDVLMLISAMLAMTFMQRYDWRWIIAIG